MAVLTDEKAHAIHGVPGRMFAATYRDDEGPGLFCSQKWLSEARPVKGYGQGAVLRAEIRFDDVCRNGHNTFSMTGDLYRLDHRVKHGRKVELAAGCLHDEIAQAFPELVPLIKWHLCASDGPMHYVANTIYLAGDRDCWGLRKGEQRQRFARNGQPIWELVAFNTDGAIEPIYGLNRTFVGEAPPPVPTLEWRPSMETGDGKQRELDAARAVAIWPEATDADLCQDDPDALRAALEARLPSLLQAFRRDVEAAGFLWERPQ